MSVAWFEGCMETGKDVAAGGAMVQPRTRADCVARSGDLRRLHGRDPASSSSTTTSTPYAQLREGAARPTFEGYESAAPAARPNAARSTATTTTTPTSTRPDIADCTEHIHSAVSTRPSTRRLSATAPCPSPTTPRSDELTGATAERPPGVDAALRRHQPHPGCRPQRPHRHHQVGLQDEQRTA